MKRLIEWRDAELNAVYHEKNLHDILLTMTHKLEEHMTGMSRTQETAPSGSYVGLFLFYLLDS